MRELIFAEIMIGRDFRFEGHLYCKTSWETAMPIDFGGDEVLFMWNTVVTPE